MRWCKVLCDGQKRMGYAVWFIFCKLIKIENTVEDCRKFSGYCMKSDLYAYSCSS